MSTEDLQRIEHAFLASPRQPRIPLPEEYPPTPAHSSPHSRKLKRMLLSAMTPTQNSWRKKKKIREKQKNEAIEHEAAARAIMMLSSSNTAPELTPPRSEHKSSTSPGNCRVRKCYLPVYEKCTNIYDAVSDIPDYDSRSKRIGKSLPRREVSPPPAVISHKNRSTGSPHQYYQFNRPLPPPPKYYKPKHPPMFGRPLAEDPFYSTPIIRNNISTSRYRTPPSPPLSKK